MRPTDDRDHCRLLLVDDFDLTDQLTESSFPEQLIRVVDTLTLRVQVELLQERKNWGLLLASTCQYNMATHELNHVYLSVRISCFHQSMILQ